MATQKITQQALRRLVNPSRSTGIALTRFATPAAVATNTHFIQKRHAATAQTSESDAQRILAEQRLKRPVSPHLTIYRPQITWYGSALNRITGSILSGGFYIFGSAYLIAPLLGWHLESATIAASFAAWPLVAKVAAKFFFAFPFTYHSFNGIRHLAWDMGWAFSNKTVQQTGWAVVGLSTVTALALTFV